MGRRTLLPLIPVLAWALASVGSAAQGARYRGRMEPTDVLTWGYREWQKLGSDARQAYLSGFVAGAAWTEAGGPKAGDAVAAGIDRLLEERRLTFDLHPNVYLARLADHYFWENHRGDRLVRALHTIDRSLSP
ncbi:MAG: hypothetical protein ACE5JR_07080 [Gemmatimonadota bacterium]